MRSLARVSIAIVIAAVCAGFLYMAGAFTFGIWQAWQEDGAWLIALLLAGQYGVAATACGLGALRVLGRGYPKPVVMPLAALGACSMTLIVVFAVIVAVATVTG